jgi:Spy/CpxP family protein refolding chaperone
MKKVLMLAVLLCASTVIFAQNEERREGGRREFNPEDFAKRQTEWMKKELSLTDAQTKKVDSINLVFAKKQQEQFANRQRGGENQTDAERQAAREKRMKEMQDLNAKRDSAYAKVLTKEQLETYKKKSEEMRSQFGGRRGEGRGNRPDGAPAEGSTRPARPSRNTGN